MNPKSLVKLSNYIGLTSIILLIYWVFTFITSEVFGFRVFRENLTETFYMSIIGILALMLGALIINIMFNLTRIAQKHNNDSFSPSIGSRKKLLALAMGFPLIFIIQFGGDYLTTQRKKTLLLNSAQSIIEQNPQKIACLTTYQFTKTWISKTETVLDILSKTDSNFPQISVIVSDTLDQSPVLLGFRYYQGQITDTLPPRKNSYIQSTTPQERAYLKNIFTHQTNKIRFSAHDGRYELFYPVTNNNQTIVLWFSEYQRYGKIGS